MAQRVIDVLIPSGNKRDYGKKIEDFCARWLQQKGLQIIEQNFQCKLGEIDIIASDRETLLFVEVRFRKASGYGGAEASVDKRKQVKLSKTAAYFLQKRSEFAHYDCRFDVLALSGQNMNYEVNWIQNAFYTQPY